MAGLVFEWLLKLGGLKKIEELNIKKSNYLYNFIDADDFYINDIEIKNRSRMNIPFKLANDDLTKIFVEKAEQEGLYALKGHRLVGGLRASLYNAMPFDGLAARSRKKLGKRRFVTNAPAMPTVRIVQNAPLRKSQT